MKVVGRLDARSLCSISNALSLILSPFWFRHLLYAATVLLIQDVHPYRLIHLDFASSFVFVHLFCSLFHVIEFTPLHLRCRTSLNTKKVVGGASKKSATEGLMRCTWCGDVVRCTCGPLMHRRGPGVQRTGEAPKWCGGMEKISGAVEAQRFTKLSVGSVTSCTMHRRCKGAQIINKQGVYCVSG